MSATVARLKEELRQKEEFIRAVHEAAGDAECTCGQMELVGLIDIQRRKSEDASRIIDRMLDYIGELKAKKAP